MLYVSYQYFKELYLSKFEILCFKHFTVFQLNVYVLRLLVLKADANIQFKF